MRRPLALLCLSTLLALAGCADDSGGPRVADDVKLPEGGPAAPAAAPAKPGPRGTRAVTPAAPATAGGAATVQP